MSTKRLSKTAIEGGRDTSNKFDRNLSHREERQLGKLACVVYDDGETASVERRSKVGKEFSDKLAPVRRWMLSQVGRIWSEISSELFAKFDTRTTAGRHIVYDHMLSQVDYPGCVKLSGERYRRDFYVDENDILCHDESNRYRRHVYRGDRRSKEEIARVYKAISEWTAGRQVIDYGSVQFWAESNSFSWQLCDGRCPREHQKGVRAERVIDPKYTSGLRAMIEGSSTVYYHDVTFWRCYRADGVLRQGARFSREDAKFWSSLREGEKKGLLFVSAKELDRRMREANRAWNAKRINKK